MNKLRLINAVEVLFIHAHSEIKVQKLSLGEGGGGGGGVPKGTVLMIN